MNGITKIIFFNLETIGVSLYMVITLKIKLQNTVLTKKYFGYIFSKLGNTTPIQNIKTFIHHLKTLRCDQILIVVSLTGQTLLPSTY